MNLDKAIDLIFKNQVHLKTSYDYDLFKAILLGYQALKRIQHVRLRHDPANIHLLPGETTD